MSSQDGEEAPNDDSSGDVIIENWSDNDSDVICIDSPEKDKVDKVVKKDKDTKVMLKTNDDDSDDCVILDDESIEDQCENIDTPLVTIAYYLLVNCVFVFSDKHCYY